MTRRASVSFPVASRLAEAEVRAASGAWTRRGVRVDSWSAHSLGWLAQPLWASSAISASICSTGGAISAPARSVVPR